MAAIASLVPSIVVVVVVVIVVVVVVFASSSSPFFDNDVVPSCEAGSPPSAHPPPPALRAIATRYGRRRRSSPLAVVGGYRSSRGRINRIPKAGVGGGDPLRVWRGGGRSSGDDGAGRGVAIDDVDVDRRGTPGAGEVAIPTVQPPPPNVGGGGGAAGRPPPPPSCSAWSVQGMRRHMEDEYFVEGGSGSGTTGGTTFFAAVFDGHGGSAVSRYLRQNLYASFQAALPKAASSSPSSSSSARRRPSIVASALEAALDKVDSEVGSISHWSFQGSTALAIVVHENDDDADDDGGGGGGSGRSIVVANVGDSRAVLCRSGRATDLTRDHKPNDAEERARIERHGGTVGWCGEVDPRTGHPIRGSGVYRINGNLALSRSIGDRAERPWVTADADVVRRAVNEVEDEFVLIATDGLFDVMSSAEAVSFVNDLLGRTTTTHPDRRNGVRRDMARHLVEEALRRGTTDNVTVLIIWINDDKI